MPASEDSTPERNRAARRAIRTILRSREAQRSAANPGLRAISAVLSAMDPNYRPPDCRPNELLEELLDRDED